MKVTELKREQLVLLKERMISDEMYITEGREASCEELERADELVKDEMVFKAFADEEFSEDDFSEHEDDWCR